MTGIDAVQAIHFGLRPWCVDQLSLLDELYQLNGTYTMYACNIAPLSNRHHLATQMAHLLPFQGEWATIRVGDFALLVGARTHTRIDNVKEILRLWESMYPDVVAGIATNERFITVGMAQRQRELGLKGFLVGSQGNYLSHLRIHRNILHKIQQEAL